MFNQFKLIINNVSDNNILDDTKIKLHKERQSWIKAIAT